jgi:hypothetical protein
MLTDCTFLFAAQRLDTAFTANAADMEGTDLQRTDRIRGRIAAPDASVIHKLFLP